MQRIAQLASAFILAVGAASCFSLSFGPLDLSGLGNMGADLDASSDSMGLDFGTWSVMACGSESGVPSLLVLADPDPEGPDGRLRTWIVSARDFWPRFELVPSRGEGGVIVAMATPMADLDGDGVTELEVEVVRIPNGEPSTTGSKRMVISGRDGVPLCDQAIVKSQSSVEQLNDLFSCVLDPRSPSWRDGLMWPRALVTPVPAAWTAIEQSVLRAHPQLALLYSEARETEVPRDPAIHPCGDIDGDGQIDWMGVANEPSRVLVFSGADAHVLREITIASDRFATAAAGVQAIGDVDGDGVADLLVVGHVSDSAERLSRRTCRLGFASIVSGADGHVIRTLEHDSFVEGPGAHCPRVLLPD